MVIQVLQPVMMRGMDYWCCGSIKGRGILRGMKGIKKWMKDDIKGTKYCAELDIRHFYNSLINEVVINRMNQLIKDKRMMDIISQLLSNGIMIGAYYSQWFANTVLQPLDALIRKMKVKHYIRYMDNLTLFDSSKRKLHKVIKEIEHWLNLHHLQLKSNWQVFNTSERMPCALGFRYGHGYTFLRKKTLLRDKRMLSRIVKKFQKRKYIAFKTAAGIVSRLGQFKHFNSTNIYRKLVPCNLIKRLKQIIRRESLILQNRMERLLQFST